MNYPYLVSQKCAVYKNRTFGPGYGPPVPTTLNFLFESDKMTDEDGDIGHNEDDGEQGRGPQPHFLTAKHQS